jgi:hypothetical protein
LLGVFLDVTKENRETPQEAVIVVDIRTRPLPNVRLDHNCYTTILSLASYGESIFIECAAYVSLTCKKTFNIIAENRYNTDVMRSAES